MSRRKVVNLNLEVLLPLIKKVCRSNVVFCEEMGRPKQKTWVTGWSNKPNPKNLPSPEEAARMCILLNTTPEEILLHEGKDEKETAKCQEDIKLVWELVEKEKGIKKAPATEGEGVDDKIVQFIRSASAEELTEILRYIDFLESKRENP
jgi:hypothetical protein